MNEYSMMTQELQDLAALSMEHGQIPSGLYDQYHVLRGLRDVNGKGVLAGLTDISTITSSKEVDGKMVPCDGELRYRGYDIHDLVDGFVAEQRFGYEEVAYLLIFGRLPEEEELKEFQKLLGSYRTLPTNFVRDVIMKAPGKDMMNTLQRGVPLYTDTMTWQIIFLYRTYSVSASSLQVPYRCSQFMAIRHITTM